jgi:hypothetical protein
VDWAPDPSRPALMAWADGTGTVSDARTALSALAVSPPLSASVHAYNLSV